VRQLHASFARHTNIRASVSVDSIIFTLPLKFKSSIPSTALYFQYFNRPSSAMAGDKGIGEQVRSPLPSGSRRVDSNSCPRWLRLSR